MAAEAIPPLGRLGFGCGPIGNLYSPMNDADAEAVLEAAWNAGIRYFDTAPQYGFGLGERRLGDFLRGRPRKRVMISTKVGRRLHPNAGDHPARAFYPGALPFEPRIDLGYDGVMRSFEDSLQRLGLDRVDILLLHDVTRSVLGDAYAHGFATAMDGGWRALDRLRREKAVAAIGIGLGECAAAREAIDAADWDLLLLAGRLTLLDHGDGARLLERCRERGTAVIAAAPFNSGILAGGAAADARFDYRPAGDAVRARAAAIERICTRHGTPLAHAALRFGLLFPGVACVLAGFATPGQVAEAAGALARPIPDALWAELAASGLVSLPCAPAA